MDSFKSLLDDYHSQWSLKSGHEMCDDDEVTSSDTSKYDVRARRLMPHQAIVSTGGARNTFSRLPGDISLAPNQAVTEVRGETQEFLQYADSTSLLSEVSLLTINTELSATGTQLSEEYSVPKLNMETGSREAEVLEEKLDPRGKSTEKSENSIVSRRSKHSRYSEGSIPPQQSADRSLIAEVETQGKHSLSVSQSTSRGSLYTPSLHNSSKQVRNFICYLQF